MSKLILIDGSGFIFRAYHAMAHSRAPLTNPAGVPVGAVYGYSNMLRKVLEENKPDYLAVIFDAARVTFRNRIYPEYKAHRPPAPDDLIPQFPLVREATEAYGVPAIELADYEADDIIASYARLARAQGMEVTIISSDKDLMQLVGSGVSMLDAMKNKVIGDAEVMEKFGVPPARVRDVLALIGDTSDNVPGVPSIGPKTAAELINQYGDLETLLARASEVKQPKRREAIENNIEKARLSYQLIGLEDHVPNLPALTELVAKPRDDAKLTEFLTRMGFKSLLAKVGQPFIPSLSRDLSQAGIDPSTPLRSAQDKAIPYETISTESALIEWLAAARKKGVVAFDTETTSLQATQAELVGFSLCSEVGKACYVPIRHQKPEARTQTDLFSPVPTIKQLAPNQLTLDIALKHLVPLLADDSVVKVGHNIKYDMIVMHRYGCSIANFDDTMILSYNLTAGLHGQGMDELAAKYLGMKLIAYDEVTGTGAKRIRFDEVEIEKATAYAAEDADVTLRFYEQFKPRIAAEKLSTLYETIEKPLVPVIARMEEAGIKVDVAKLRALSSGFDRKILTLEEEIKSLAGVDFNVASPKQLGEILFERMGIEGGKKSAKTGAYGTGAEVLEELAEAGHVIAEKVLEHRGLSKLKNTYCDTLPQQINPKTGRVHTNYGLAIAATGRLSSSDPNVQNIPIRSEEGKRIREAFVAEEGNVLLSADYSQIELRLLAHMADIEVLKEAFRNGDDIHAITAAKVFHVPLAEMTKELRSRAKAVNFGIIYGISAHGLSVQLGIGRAEAADIINSYFATYPGIRDFMEACKEFARANGYVETLYKRRCHTPLINDKNAARRAFAERAAINAPLQGTAADIIKKAMVQLSCALPRSVAGSNLRDPAFAAKAAPQDCRLLLQVHDELIFECAENAAALWSPKIKTIMENAASLSVPLTVEVGIGKHWGSAH